MVWIKLNCHSSTVGAVGLIGDIIDADSKAAEYLLSDGAATKVNPPQDFEPFVQVPSFSEVKPAAAAKQPEPEVVSVPMGENPKRAKV